MTTTLDTEYRQHLLDRFLRYVKVDTRSDEASESSPTTEKQKDLSRMLAEELKELGCDDAEMTEWGYVFATVPGNLPADHPAAGKTPTIGLIAHVDTYFGTSGKDVQPQMIESYDGSDIRLNPEQGKSQVIGRGRFNPAGATARQNSFECGKTLFLAQGCHHLAEFRNQKGDVGSCHMYSTSMISYSRSPAGARTTMTSPTSCPISALEMGELTAMRWCLISASTSPTIW